eukprot:5036084-Pyramimonas_sp.AAC.1
MVCTRAHKLAMGLVIGRDYGNLWANSHYRRSHIRGPSSQIHQRNSVLQLIYMEDSELLSSGRLVA